MMLPEALWAAMKWKGLSSTLADVEALAPDSDASEPEKEDAEEQDEDEDVESKPKQMPKKEKWWDRDRHVNKAHKTLTTAYEKFVRVGKLPAQQMQGD